VATPSIKARRLAQRHAATAASHTVTQSHSHTVTQSHSHTAGAHLQWVVDEVGCVVEEQRRRSRIVLRNDVQEAVPEVALLVIAVGEISVHLRAVWIPDRVRGTLLRVPEVNTDGAGHVAGLLHPVAVAVVKVTQCCVEPSSTRRVCWGCHARVPL
jgi:hypothetical protein